MTFLKHEERRPKLNIGHTVKVVEPGWTFDCYHDIADQYNLNQWADCGNLPNKKDLYKVTHIIRDYGNHKIVIRDLNNGLQYIMDTSAVEIFQEETAVDIEKIQEEISKKPQVFFDVNSLG